MPPQGEGFCLALSCSPLPPLLLPPFLTIPLVAPCACPERRKAEEDEKVEEDGIEEERALR